MSLPKTSDIVDEILYGNEGPYVSTLPVLMCCHLRDILDRFLIRLFKTK